MTSWINKGFVVFWKKVLQGTQVHIDSICLQLFKSKTSSWNFLATAAKSQGKKAALVVIEGAHIL